MNVESTYTVQESYEKILRAVPFFCNLSKDEIADLAAVCVPESFVPGDIIFRENTNADKFYIIIDGQVEVWKAYQLPSQCQIGSHGPGHIFGEMALLDEQPRSATLIATQAVHALVILREDFLRLVRKSGNLALSILLSMSQIVRDSNDVYVQNLSDKNLRLEQAYTELKSAHEEMLRNERLSTIGKFSSIIFHDIRNPLAVIKVSTDLIALNKDDPEQVEQGLHRLRREIDRMERLAQDFLDYSRGEVRLDLTVTSVDRILSQLRTSSEGSLKKAGIQLHIEYDINTPFIVDEERFLRVLINLVDNARKAMDEGGSLTIHVAKNKERLVFTMRDTGVGMSTEATKRVFEPFFSESRKGGTGLGMLIVNNIIEAHEGDISISSVPGAGTTVKLTLPTRL